MFPPNIIEASTDNRQLLGIIVFSLLFGFFIGRLPEKHRAAQSTFWQGVLGVMMLVTDLIIKFTPLGVFGLVTPIVINTGFALFEPLFWFVLDCVARAGLPHVRDSGAPTAVPGWS